jgi:hypothetical protein
MSKKKPFSLLSSTVIARIGAYGVSISMNSIDNSKSRLRLSPPLSPTRSVIMDPPLL